MHRSRRSILSGAVAAAAVAALPVPAHASGGRFVGSVVARWGDDGRTMTLTEPFEYIGPDKRRWPVPSGTVVDGASIPRFFWTFIGGPFEGSYRNASVVHDHYCNVRTRKYPDVHRMFYDAMITSGVTTGQARLMSAAVDRFGPRWDDPKIDPRCEIVDENYDFKACARNSRPPRRQDPPLGRSEIEAFIRSIESDASPADVEKLREAAKTLR